MTGVWWIGGSVIGGSVIGGSVIGGSVDQLKYIELTAQKIIAVTKSK